MNQAHHPQACCSPLLSSAKALLATSAVTATRLEAASWALAYKTVILEDSNPFTTPQPILSINNNTAKMRSRFIFGSLACLTAIIHASPIGSPIDDASPHKALQKRNILVPAYLIPTSTINAEVVAGTPVTVSEDRVPTSTVDVAKRDVSTIPDLVPTVEVDLVTSLGTPAATPLFMPTRVADIGVTTSGCVVSISDYSYVTKCNHPPTPTPTSTGIANCCGGQHNLHPCNDAGTIPTGPATWTCTFGYTTCAGVSTATAMWT